MRKALMGLLLAATAVSPLAAPAMAQGRGDRDTVSREQRSEARQERRAQRSEARSDRAERRQERAARPNAQRGERRANRVEAPATRGRTNVRTNVVQRPAAQPSTRNRTVYGGSAANVRHYQELERRNQQRYGQRSDRRDDRRDWRNDRRDDRRDWRQDRRSDRGDWQRDRRDWSRDWNRSWRNDRRYDWQRYRNYNRNAYHVGRYYSPYRGHRYNRLSIGLFLNSGFFGSNYWITDPWQYRLPPAYAGTRWVRYYDDVVLVDTYTGEVIDVIENFFW